MIIDKYKVKQISNYNNEPEWLLNKRIEAFDKFTNTPIKISRRFDYSKFNIENYEFLENGETSFNEAYINGKISNSIYKKAKERSLIQIGKNSVNHLNINGLILKDVRTILKENSSLLKKYLYNFYNNVKNDQFELYNYVCWQNGYFLYVPENFEVELPLQYILIHNNEGEAIFLNNFIILEKGSKIKFIDSQISIEANKDSLINSMLNVYLADGAQLDYISIQEYGNNINSINNKKFFLQKDAVVNWFELVFGGKATQNNYEANLLQKGAQAYMQGIYFAGKDQQMQFNTAQLHYVGYTKSDLLYIGALRDNAITSYEGIIHVNKGAQKTDAYQKNKNLILSKEAHADSEPLLEILANDVRCTHGATIAPIDPDDLFYLMSRGIERDLAKKLLISGFFSEVSQKIPIAEIKDAIQAHIEENI